MGYGLKPYPFLPSKPRKPRKMTYDVIKGHWHLMTSVDLGKVTMPVKTMDVTSQHLSMSKSPAKIPKFGSFRRWNGTERKFRLAWPWKSKKVKGDNRYGLEIFREGVKLFKGLVYQVSWRSADRFASYSRKTRGGCITLGFRPLYFENGGKCIFCVKKKDAEIS